MEEDRGYLTTGEGEYVYGVLLPGHEAVRVPSCLSPFAPADFGSIEVASAPVPAVVVVFVVILKGMRKIAVVMALKDAVVMMTVPKGRSKGNVSSSSNHDGSAAGVVVVVVFLLFDGFYVPSLHHSPFLALYLAAAAAAADSNIWNRRLSLLTALLPLVSP